MTQHEDIKKVAADLAKQFVDAVDQARVLGIEEAAGYVERASPCHCRDWTAKAIRQLKGEAATPGESEGT